MRRETTVLAAMAASALAWSGAVAQPVGGGGGYGTTPLWATGPTASGAPRYHAGRRARRIAPSTPPATIPFDAKIVPPADTAGMPPGSPVPDAGARLGSRFDRRDGSRVGTAWASRIGNGGAVAVPRAATSDDPRDRLESKRTRYDTPQ